MCPPAPPERPLPPLPHREPLRPRTLSGFWVSPWRVLWLRAHQNWSELREYRDARLVLNIFWGYGHSQSSSSTLPRLSRPPSRSARRQRRAQQARARARACALIPRPAAVGESPLGLHRSRCCLHGCGSQPRSRPDPPARGDPSLCPPHPLLRRRSGCVSLIGWGVLDEPLFLRPRCDSQELALREAVCTILVRWFRVRRWAKGGRAIDPSSGSPLRKCVA